MDFGMFIRNCYLYLTTNEVADGDRKYFTIAYVFTHIAYLYCFFPLFLFNTKLLPDTIKNRLRLRRCMLWIMFSQVFSVVLLTFAYLYQGDKGWLTSGITYIWKMVG